MRFAKMIMAAAALALSGIAGQAQAMKFFSISGTLTPDQYGDASAYLPAMFPNIGPPFVHGATASFSAPVNGELELYSYYTYLFLDKFGNELDGNEIDFYATSLLNNSQFARATKQAPVTPLGNGVRYVEYSRGTSATISLFGLSAPVNYTLSGFSAAPEPTTWALMILGMGAVGGALRRRRASSGNIRSGIVECAARTVIGG